MKSPRRLRAFVFLARAWRPDRAPDSKASHMRSLTDLCSGVPRKDSVMYKVRAVLTTILASMMLALLCSAAVAVGPVFWEITKQEDVIKGDARGVSIGDNGTINLAPSFTLVYDTKEAYIWSSATDSAGNVYLGTGHDGK